MKSQANAPAFSLIDNEITALNILKKQEEEIILKGVAILSARILKLFPPYSLAADILSLKATTLNDESPWETLPFTDKTLLQCILQIGVEDHPQEAGSYAYATLYVRRSDMEDASILPLEEHAVPHHIGSIFQQINEATNGILCCSLLDQFPAEFPDMMEIGVSCDLQKSFHELTS